MKPAGRKKPQRTCLGCREVKNQSEMIRFVQSPDNDIIADLKGRLPGRGAYLCFDKTCFQQAVKKKQFDRAFRTDCGLIDPAQLDLHVKEQLLGRLANLVGMARKSSGLVSGSNAVLEAFNGKRKPAVVIMAQDISEQIAGKVCHKAQQNRAVIISLFDKEKLGHILGRAERSVVGLHDGQLAEAFIKDLRRYQDISGEV